MKQPAFSSIENLGEAFDRQIRLTLAKNCPRDWDEENHLTRSVLRVLRDEFSDVEVGRIFPQLSIKWDAFKLSGGVETLYGDIGVLVRIQFGDSHPLEGVAFLEAKRAFFHPNYENATRGTFDSMTWDQLRRQDANTPFHRVVLYDCHRKRGADGSPIDFAFCTTLPTPHVLALGTTDREIQRFGEPFGMCLAARYFRGYELDYREETITAIKGFANSKFGVEYLVVASVRIDGEATFDLRQMEVNLNRYERIPDYSEVNDVGAHDDTDDEDDEGNGLMEES